MKKEACAGALEGTFLQVLTQLTSAKSVVEIGMFTGTTTLAIAKALPGDGKVGTLDNVLLCDYYLVSCIAARALKKSSLVAWI